MQPCVVSTQEVMLALKVAIAVGGCLGGVFSKAANAMFQLSNSSHEITWSLSVLLACFVHTCTSPQTRESTTVITNNYT